VVYIVGYGSRLEKWFKDAGGGKNKECLWGECNCSGEKVDGYKNILVTAQVAFDICFVVSVSGDVLAGGLC